ncbi:hypothetical protein HK097_009078, partial [Rhizophlyctis rosea]
MVARGALTAHAARCQYKAVAELIENLTSANDVIAKKESENAALRSDVHRAKEESARRERTIEGLNLKSRNHVDEIQSLSAKLDNLKKEVAERDEQIQSIAIFKREVEIHEQHKTGFEKKILELNTLIDSMQRTAQKANIANQMQVEEARSQLETSQRQLEASESQSEELQKRLDAAEKQLEASRWAILKDAGSTQQQEALQLLEVESKRRAGKQQGIIVGLQNKISEKNRLIHEHETKIAAFKKAKVEQYAEAIEEFVQSRLEEVKKENEERLQALEANLATLEKRKDDEKKVHESTVHHLNTIVKNLRHEVQEQQRTIQNLTTTVTEKTHEVLVLHEETENLRASMRVLEIESAETHQITEDLRDALKTKDHELAESKQTVTSLTARMERDRTTYRQQMTQWRTQLDAKEREKAGLHEKIENIQGLVGVLKEEKRQQKQQLRRLAVENDGLKEGKHRQLEQHQAAPAAEAVMEGQQQIIHQLEQRERLKQQAVVRELRIEIDTLKRQKADGEQQIRALRDSGRKLKNDRVWQEERIDEMSGVLWNLDPEKRMSLDQSARVAKGVQVETLDATSSNVVCHPVDGSCAIALSANGNLVLIAMPDDTVVGWNISSNKEILRLVGHTAPITSVTMSDDENYILTGSEDTTAKLWLRMPTDNLFELFKSFEGHTNHVRCVAMHESKWVLTGSRDRTAMLWDIENTNVLSCFVGHSDEVLAGCISGDGNIVVTGSADNTAKIWHAQTGEHLFNLDQEHPAPVRFVATTEDGNRCVTYGINKVVTVWNYPERTFGWGEAEVLCVLKGAEKFVSREDGV